MRKRIEFISFKNFKKIYRAEKKKEMKLLYLLAFGAGLRLSELVGLEKEISSCCKAELEVRRVKIEGTTLKKKYCSQCKEEISLNDIRRKKGEWKISPITAENINLQSHQIRIDEAKGGKWRVTITPPLLNEAMLKLLPLKVKRRTAQYRFDVLCRKVLGQKLSIHILRHGFGNYQVNVLKLPLPIVQQMMGHSRLDTTGIYTKANPEEAIASAWKAITGEE